jgi:Fic family protein
VGSLTDGDDDANTPVSDSDLEGLVPGSFRTTDLNIEIRWFEITEAVKQVVDNFALRFAATANPNAECVDFHHQLVSIHPFVNGNGRHARAIADAAAVALDQPPFTWGSESIVAAQETRTAYIEALRRADDGDLAPLHAFARS